MLIEVHCESCKELVASKEVESIDFATALALMVHASSSHKSSHSLRLFVEKSDVFAGPTVRVIFHCIELRCRDQPPAIFNIPSSWMGAAAVLYHSSHEGHSIEWSVGHKMLWDGKKVV